MSRKPFLDLTRQGKMKRIRKSLQLQIEVEDDNTFEENDPSVSFSYGSNSYDENASSSQTLPPRPEVGIHIDEAREQKQKSDFQEIFDNISSSDESDADCWATNLSESEKLRESLKVWSVQFHVTNVALSALLCILKTHKCFHLPLDARSLLKTPSSVPIRSVAPGSYCHIGLRVGLEKLLFNIKEVLTSVQLLIGIDGLPLFNSSSGELWPILASVWNVPAVKSIVFPVGIYFGKKKPLDCRDFLREFVNEAANLIKDGISLNGNNVRLTIKGFCCDAPAKAFILGVKGHTGYSSCTKCKQEGSFFNNRMTFPEFDGICRTHEGFLRREDPEFHTAETPLIEIPRLHFVNSFPLDYMHLVCLGVMRTMLYTWIFAAVPLKLPSRIIDSISSHLLTLASHIPLEFCRKPRGLDQIRRWKATEFRQFLLYTGPVVLHDALKSDYSSMYSNFLSLNISMTILLSPKFCQQHQQYSKELLEHFLKTFKNLYGQQYLTHNFHGLTHISEDVSIFGAVDSCSAFQLENYLQSLKKLIRKGDKPLQQVVKRLGEIANCNVKFSNSPSFDNYPECSSMHTSGPLVEGCDASKQYKVLQFQSFKITTSPPNCYCTLVNGSIAVVSNVVFSSVLQCMVLLYREFLEKHDFYGHPFCKSSELEIYQVHKLSDLKVIPVSEIYQKLVLLPFNGKHIAMPLLHLV